MTQPHFDNSVMSDLKVEVAMLKSEVAFINKLFEKMDAVMSKIDSQHDLLIDKTTKTESNLHFTKDELTTLNSTLERTEREISERISSIEKLLSNEIKSINSNLTTRLDKQEEITNGFLNIKMIIFGVLAVVAYLSSNLDFIKKIF